MIQSFLQLSSKKLLRNNFYKTREVLVDHETISSTAERSIEFLSSDEKYIWWDLFQEVASGKNPNEKESEPKMPTVSAWHALEKSIDEVAPPSSLSDYLVGKYDLCETHTKKTNELWAMIKNRGSMKHLADSDVQRVIEALKIAYVALWGKQTSRSLEASINLATGLAAVLGELQASLDVVLAGILNEVVADLEGPERANLISALESRFGEDVVSLAQKCSSLPRFMARKADYTIVQSENQLQMLVMSVEDYRSLYIRLADRLHTLRVLRKLPDLDDQDRKKIAQEALNVYAPLAHKMGVMKVKGELEDLSFRVLEPDMFLKTKYTQTAANKAYHEVAERVQDLVNHDTVLTSQDASIRLTYRIKDKYQLYLKMKRKGLKSPNEVRDALGLRLIVDVPVKVGETEEAHSARSTSLCYYIVERLRQLSGWEPSENGYKDYIQRKKENGYQSLHQYIRNIALGTNVEIQVRTRQMHVNAELGGAAHWFYKDLIYRPEIANSKNYKQTWRSEEQINANSAAEILGVAQKFLKQNRVFVYLDDKSTVLNLKKGSTALDAAFSIHTGLGMRAESASIDGVDVALDQELKTGDVIAIKTSKDNSTVIKPTHLNFVKTTHASFAMRKYFRTQRKSTSVCLGLIQLLMSLSLNEDRVGVRFPGKVYDLPHLMKLTKHRLGMEIEDFLLFIGSSVVSKEEFIDTISRLFDLSKKDLIVSSSEAAMLWGKMQVMNGWEDEMMRTKILIPLLKDILPLGKGLEQVEDTWNELVGVGSLEEKAVKVLEEGELQLLMQQKSVIEAPFNVEEMVMMTAQDMEVRRNLKSLLKQKEKMNNLMQAPYSLNASLLSPSMLKSARSKYGQTKFRER